MSKYWRKHKNSFDPISHMDRGARDEGFARKWCQRCSKKTEHDLNNCITCLNKKIKG